MTNEEFEALSARLMPKFSEYLARNSKNIFDCELAQSLEGITSMPTLYSLNGVRKQVIVPLQLFTADLDKQLAAADTAVSKANAAVETANQASATATAAAKTAADAVSTVNTAAANANAAAKSATDAVKNLQGTFRFISQFTCCIF